MHNPILHKLYQFRRVVVLLIICLVFAVMLPGIFLTWGNFRSVLYSVSLTGIMI